MEVEVQKTKTRTVAALTGLAVAWGRTALLISPLLRGFADPSMS
jgi:hypothetical protein